MQLKRNFQKASLSITRSRISFIKSYIDVKSLSLYFFPMTFKERLVMVDHTPPVRKCNYAKKTFKALKVKGAIWTV